MHLMEQMEKKKVFSRSPHAGINGLQFAGAWSLMGEGNKAGTTLRLLSRAIN